MTKFLKKILCHISEGTKVKKNQSKILKEFIDFIEFQSAAKQLSFCESFHPTLIKNCDNNQSIFT